MKWAALVLTLVSHDMLPSQNLWSRTLEHTVLRDRFLIKFHKRHSNIIKPSSLQIYATFFPW